MTKTTLYPLAKRSFDVTAAAIALLLLSPIFVIVSATLWFTIGRPILFRQVRIGWKEYRFCILKFRTMNVLRDSSGRLLPDAQRLTSLGRWLRALSIDELPQFFNVLKGDMSLVGPRPLLPEYVDRYDARQRRRHEVKPGITGWAQIKGRNSLTWEEKFHLDVWYVDHCSFQLDIKILCLTLLQVVRRVGISSQGHPTMNEFMGSTRGIEHHD